MHACLLIDEIISLIFEFLAASKSRQDLAALSRTCRAFSDKALDILWRDPPSLGVLIQYTLPPYLWRETLSDSNENLKLLRGTPLPADWDRFTLYASRVKVLVYRDSADRLLEREKFDYTYVFQQLNSCASTSPLFPRLVYIDWYDAIPTSLPHIALFLGSCIHRIKLHFRPASTLSPDILAVLHRIRDNCPLLEHVALHGLRTPNSNSLTSPIFHFLGHFDHLRILELSELGHRAVFDLVKLPTVECITIWLESSNSAWSMPSLDWDSPFPSLKELHIYNICNSSEMSLPWLCALRSSPLQKLVIDWRGYQVTEPEQFNVPPLLESAFPNLQTLRFGAPYLKYAIKLMKYMPLRNLQKLKVKYRFCNYTDPENLVRMISERCSPSALTSLDIYHELAERMYSRREEYNDNYSIGDAALRPLLTLKNLTSIVLRLTCRFDLSNSLIEDMAKAWEGLTHIELPSYSQWANTSTLTLDGLIPLVRSCPSLAHVELPVNASTVPLLQEYDFSAVECQSQGVLVEILDFGRSPLAYEDVANAAAFIKRLFPNLKSFQAQHLAPSRCRWLRSGHDEREVCPWFSVCKLVCNRRR